MIKMIQILFVLLIVAMAIANAIVIFSWLARVISHSMPDDQKKDVFAVVDPGEIARRSITPDPVDITWDWNEVGNGDFSDFTW